MLLISRWTGHAHSMLVPRRRGTASRASAGQLAVMFKEMKLRIAILLVLALFLPDVAWANSMAPIFPMLSVVGWLALPIIILIEGAFYSRKSVRYPFKLSLYSNLWSAVVGLLLAAVTFPVMLGPAIDAYLDIIFIGATVTTIGLVFHWWFSSHLEHKFSKWHKLWKDQNLPLLLFYKANGLSYGIISLFFLVKLIILLMKYKTKT